MASDLLNKGNRINRQATAIPQEKYSEGKGKVPEKFTSVRVSESMKNTLNAMVAMGSKETVDTIVQKLTEFYIDEKYTDEEKQKFKFMMEVYKNK